jgi:hypothetical protein
MVKNFFWPFFLKKIVIGKMRRKEKRHKYAENVTTRAQSYKIFYNRNLQMFVFCNRNLQMFVFYNRNLQMFVFYNRNLQTFVIS